MTPSLRVRRTGLGYRQREILMWYGKRTEPVALTVYLIEKGLTTYMEGYVAIRRAADNLSKRGYLAKTKGEYGRLYYLLTDAGKLALEKAAKEQSQEIRS